MPSSEDQIKRIQEKLLQLVKQYASLKKENQVLKDELHGIKKQAAAYQQNAEELKQQVSILKYSGGEMSVEEKKQFEKRINGYIKEIDRCIAMLSE